MYSQINSIDHDEFRTWVNEQGSRVIDHESAYNSYEDGSAWGNCAVGEYFTHLTGSRLTRSDAFPGVVQSELGERLYDYMGNGECNTFADLALKLEELT